MGCGISNDRRRKIELPHSGQTIAQVEEIKILPGIFVQENDRRFQEVYRIKDIIGVGTFGEVRVCVHRETGTRRAVKIYRKDLMPNETHKAKLEREISILRALDHPNIIRVFEFFEDSKRFFIVMEYCRGGELFDEINKNTKFTESQSAQIMHQLFSAVAYLHQKRIVHRDLKLENILLEEKHDLLNIKLIDFGTACVMDRFKMIHGTIGTAYYIAPEVLDGVYDEKCDLWSCGVIMYLLLTGRPPFEGRHDTEVVENVRRGSYTFEEPIWSKISPEAKNLVSKLLVPPSSRLNAGDTLKHPWITHNAMRLNANSQLLETVLKNLLNFRMENKLRDAVHTFITTQLVNPKEAKDYRDVFRMLDKNGDGKLCRQELLDEYLKILPKDEAIAAVNSIMTELDSDCSGFIDYTEFLKASMDMKSVLSLDNLRIAFNMFDKDQSGSISALELKKVLEGGTDSNDSVWKSIVNQVDQNGDGEIDFQEFQSMILNNMV